MDWLLWLVDCISENSRLDTYKVTVVITKWRADYQTDSMQRSSVILSVFVSFGHCCYMWMYLGNLSDDCMHRSRLLAQV